MTCIHQAARRIQAGRRGMKARKTAMQLRVGIASRRQFKCWNTTTDEEIIQRHLMWDDRPSVKEAALTTLLGSASEKTLPAFLKNVISKTLIHVPAQQCNSDK